MSDRTRYIDESGIVITGQAALVYDFIAICEEDTRKRRIWIAGLRTQGIRAAFPDDGWHDRERQRILSSYPHFNDGVQVGDTIAIGDHQGYIMQMITGIEITRMGLVWYHYGKDTA